MTQAKTRVSRQRALIALRSYPSVKAAARSIPTTPAALLRMTLGDPEVSRAYEECVSGVLRDRRDEEVAARKRAQPPPLVTVRTAERRRARFFATVGKDPKLASAALHKRLNHERRQEKIADLKAALGCIDEIQGHAQAMKPIPKSVLDLWDRWCGHCKAHRLDDPCDVCHRHTLLVRGDKEP
jgi:hypothetical protein